MTDLIVFSVDKNKYAISIDHIVRIVHGENLTQVPTSHPYIDGIMSYEDSIVKVLNFRKLINIKSFEEELVGVFKKLRQAHVEWLAALEKSLLNEVAFTQTLNPHMCELGKWIDSFTCYDDEMTVLLGELTESHKRLHILGGELLDISIKDRKKAIVGFNKELQEVYKQTLGSLDAFVLDIDKVSNSLQKLLIYEGKQSTFAIKIDRIDDIAHVNDCDIMSSDDESSSEFLDVSGVLDLDGVLINVISEVRLPK